MDNQINVSTYVPKRGFDDPPASKKLASLFYLCKIRKFSRQLQALPSCDKIAPIFNLSVRPLTKQKYAKFQLLIFTT